MKNIYIYVSVVLLLVIIVYFVYNRERKSENYVPCIITTAQSIKDCMTNPGTTNPQNCFPFFVETSKCMFESASLDQNAINQCYTQAEQQYPGVILQ